tara:strand:- start:88105 stop:88476 length:372 start_codon:yes stop_codon:yes gene_type:complete
MFGFDLKPGYAITDHILVYLRGGLGFGSMKLFADNDIAGHNLPSYSDTQNVMTYRLGVGAEYKFTQHFSVHVDYIINFFSQSNYSIEGAGVNIPTLPSGNITSNSIFANPQSQSVLAGVSYYF